MKTIINDIEKKASLLKANLKKTHWFLKITPEKVTKFPGARRGNKVYAYLMDKRIAPLVKKLTSKKARFLTLTLPYDYENPKESWKKFRTELPKFFRRAKFSSYLYVYEAHEKGGCHVHVIVNGGPDLATIKELWPGHIKVKAVTSAEVGAYLTKELGKAGHVETALKHLDEGKATPNDIKKIQRLYYLTTMKMRGWGASRNLSVGEPEDGEIPGDLINNINNSTDEKIKIIEIPRKIVLNPLFLPYTGRLEAGTDQWELLADLIELVRRSNFNGNFNVF